MHFIEFQQLLKQETDVRHGIAYFKQNMTMEAARITDSGEIDATLLTLDKFNKAGRKFLPNAFSDWLNSEEGLTIPMYFQHNQAHYIGVWQDFQIVRNELHAVGRLMVQISQEAKEKAAMISNGFLNRVSVGGGADPANVSIVDRRDEEGKLIGYGIIIGAAYLIETSLVLRPADETAVIHQDFSGIEQLEQSPYHGKSSMSLHDVLTWQHEPQEIEHAAQSIYCGSHADLFRISDTIQHADARDINSLLSSPYFGDGE